jgi:hypothetical protein
MDATETEFARHWGDWLRAKLANKGWKGADLRRAIEAVGGSVGPSQISRWVNGDQRPSVKNAGLVADALGVDRREAWGAAGLSGEVGGADGPIIAGDPVEPFLERVRARGFPQDVEEPLIARIRAEIQRRQQTWEEELNTVEVAMGKTPDEP